MCVCGHGGSDEWVKYKNVILRTYKFRSGCWSILCIGLGRREGLGPKLYVGLLILCEGQDVQVRFIAIQN